MAIKISKYRGGPALEVSVTLDIPGKGRTRVRRKSPVSSVSGTNRWAEALQKELLTKGLETRPRLGPTLAEFGPKYLEWCRSDGKKHAYIKLQRSIINKWLTPRLGKLRLGNVRAGHVNKLKSDLLASVSKSYGNSVLLCLRRILTVAADPDGLDEIAEVPVRIKLFKVDKNGRKAFYEFEDFERLVQAAGECDDRTRLITLLGAEAGLRIGETIELQWDDIDFRRHLIHVRRAIYDGVVDTPKGGRGRRVEMTDRLRAALQAHRHLKGKHVLYDDAGAQLTYKVALGMFEKAVRRAALVGTTHWLRHTFCSHLAIEGVTARAIQELAGHVDIKTTLGYMHLSPRSTREAIAVLNDRSRSTA